MSTRDVATHTGPSTGARTRMKTNDALQMTASTSSRAVSAVRISAACLAANSCRALSELERWPARMARLEREQRALAIETAGVAGQRAAASHDAMARDDDRQRIATRRGARGAHCRR